MVKQRGKPRVLILLCSLPQAFQPAAHGAPALCRVHDGLFRFLLGPAPSRQRFRQAGSVLFSVFGRSDFSRAFIPGLRFRSFPRRSKYCFVSDTPEISRFPCREHANVPGFTDYAGSQRLSRLIETSRVAFPIYEQGRRPEGTFRSSIAQPADPAVYASP
jgi:hypothetical protein